SLNVYSLALAAGLVPALVLAALMLRVPRNRIANRFLAGLILAIAIYTTPYVIGFAGFYDVYPWLNLAPFDISLAFGPLSWFYVMTLTGAGLARGWRLHFLPVAAQFLSQALVFPLPTAMKAQWDEAVHMPLIDPLFTVAAFVSLAVCGGLAWRRYRDYRRWTRVEEADPAGCDPTWIRNALAALLAMGVVWLAFFLVDLARTDFTYSDRFWLYFGFSLIALYLAVEGWRHAWTPFPPMPEDVAATAPSGPPAGKDWSQEGARWAAEIDRLALWRDPDVSLSSMARALGVNTTYLSKGLNDGLGMSFSAFVNGRRVEALKRLLQDPAETRDLLVLALEVGFRSKASFNRVFRESAGMTPSAFRREALEKAAAGVKPAPTGADAAR
ncbi:MAG: helix-turn-helix transcriptional regulator, partial [Parvularculaceae bacterium]|nr:helix-turn-helix transcriptional regulator [Parvularculaceae bacterium]